MLNEIVKNGVGQAFIFHATIPYDRKRRCSTHQTWSQHLLVPQLKV